MTLPSHRPDAEITLAANSAAFAIVRQYARRMRLDNTVEDIISRTITRHASQVMQFQAKFIDFKTADIRTAIRPMVQAIPEDFGTIV